MEAKVEEILPASAMVMMEAATLKDEKPLLPGVNFRKSGFVCYFDVFSSASTSGNGSRLLARMPCI